MNKQHHSSPAHHGKTQTKSGTYKPSRVDIEDIIQRGDGEKLNEVANKLGEEYSQGSDSGQNKKLSFSQIRGVLDEIQRMDPGNKMQLQLLRPKLAYAAGRHKGKVRALRDITDDAIGMVKTTAQFENFKHFFEAIVAYHRYHGGKE